MKTSATANKPHVVIAGGGSAGWMTAAALVKKLGPLLHITLIESSDIPTIGVGEATIPPLRVFHQLLGIDEATFMRETSATFKLGIEFANFGQLHDRYIHSFGQTGQSSWLAEFIHFWREGVDRGVAADYGSYCLELEAAKANKFFTSGQNSPLNYAYHLDAGAYASFLKKLAIEAGVTHITDTIEQVKLDDQGNIDCLQLANSAPVQGDLFIDCTGFRSRLIGEALSVDYEDWSHWLFCNRALAVQTALTPPLKPYTVATAHSAGWRWEIPLQHRMGNGFVYCSQFLDDSDAYEQFSQSLPSAPLTEIRDLRFNTGRRLKAWHKNCVAIGLSSGFVEPMESTSLHLIVMGITRLMQLFPYVKSDQTQTLQDEYNAQTKVELERIRDFIVLHYHVTKRDDSAFWQACQGMSIPDSLSERIALFEEHGHAFQKHSELFRVDSWSQVMLGQGILPKSWHPAAKMMSDDQLTMALRKGQHEIQQRVAQLPDHQAFIQHYCAATNTSL
ncbi:tryptophan 7-halogenase [Alteromonas sp. D210916BOD_24]|uniref:tryptophan halogenase family protein n=1 Tax=Alteromonas sp. D210916BOD_24 TaxID=3157618 RepID=UPI00399CFC80